LVGTFNYWKKADVDKKQDFQSVKSSFWQEGKNGIILFLM
jgi:hypothetical protein